MSTLSLRKIKHDGSSIDNIALNSDGTTTMGSELNVTSVKGVSANKLQLRSGDSSFGVSLQNISGVDLLAVDAVGRVTMPYQPAFSATGGGGNITISYPTALSLSSTHFNRGNHYNTSTGKFTAPVSGVYQINLTTYLNSDTANVVILVNDAQIGGSDPDNLMYKATSNPYTMGMSICVNLSANDTVSVSSRQSSGNTIFYAGHTTFSGFLVG
jgi:hypothetical protein